MPSFGVIMAPTAKRNGLASGCGASTGGWTLSRTIFFGSSGPQPALPSDTRTASSAMNDVLNIRAPLCGGHMK